WLSVPLHLLVLLYSLGRGHAKRDLGPFRDAWRRDDQEAAVLVAERDLQLTATDAPGLLRAVEGRLLWCRYQGFFAVIFWYLLLTLEHARTVAMRVRAGLLLLAFVRSVMRVLLSTFGLVGNFVAGNRSLLQ